MSRSYCVLVNRFLCKMFKLLIFYFFRLFFLGFSKFLCLLCSYLVDMSYYNSNSSNSDKQFHRSDSVPSATKRLVEMLDHVEERVELLREHASAVETERSALLCILSGLKSSKDLELITEGEREEIEINAQRLMNRTLSVDVTVTTPRNEIQQKALDKVNKLYDDLLVSMSVDYARTMDTLQQYINACLSDCRGPVHQKFQAAILECTADDQKGIRRRLENLLYTKGQR